jgi:hypothetical protein
MINEPIDWTRLKTVNKHPEYISAEGDIMAVGDINSKASGTAARANGKKSSMDLVPVSFWLNQWKASENMNIEIWDMLEALDAWQTGNDSYLLEWLGETQDIAQAIPVLEFGAKKYKAWNWAKGMNYSVSLGSLLRHTQAILQDEMLDPESGQDHWSHILCNIMFLCYHTAHFPELDDRPPTYK